MKRLRFSLTPLLALGLVLLHASVSVAQVGAAQTYASPDEAVAALIAAAKSGNQADMLRVLGAEGRALVESGDPVNDERERKRFVAAFETKHAIKIEGHDTAFLEVGNDRFPFPIPLVRVRQRWAFDAAEGKEEILNRRIGRNELDTIQTLLAIADAQYEYAKMPRPGQLFPEYAQKFISTPGKTDGLYWPVQGSQVQSPLGPLVANAVRAGYEPTARATGEPTRPYRGYHFKMLMAQGRSAPGGAHPYVVQGRMIGGFAVIAYPAVYGNSGVKTFIISYDRIVFEADLGEDTQRIAEAIRTFDPTGSWTKVDNAN